MTVYEYNDGLQSCNRRPRLYLARGKEVEKFVGQDIDGFCLIVSEIWDKNGRWSNTTYTLNLFPGVRPLYFLSPMHGLWGEWFSSWGEVIEKLSLPIEVCKELVRTEYPATAKRLDHIENVYMEAEKNDPDAELVVISFGSPSKSRMKLYWDEPKSAYDSKGNKIEIGPTQTPSGPDWKNPHVISPVGAKIILSEHKPGNSGGYYAVTVSVPTE